jgi:hypothetical protein
MKMDKLMKSFEEKKEEAYKELLAKEEKDLQEARKKNGFEKKDDK